jgi:pimeloyl-CoA dehydrogenase
MNFELTEDQLQIRETVRRLLTDRYGTAQRSGYLADGRGWSLEMWRAYAEMGLTALLVPADHGGLGGSADDQYVVMRELGRAAILEPFLGSCVAAATAISIGGSAEQRGTYLPKIASGEVVFAWAHGEQALHGVAETHAEACADGWRLSGAKTMVLHAASADHLLVSARVRADGVASLFLVPRGADGLQIQSYRLIDGSPAADIRLDRAGAVALGLPGAPAGEDVILRTEQTCIGAICAEAVGAMHAVFDLTIGYLNTRTQFGNPLATNQALRHRCADMAVMLECSESMAMLAAIALSAPEDCEPGDLLAARSVVMRHARSLCEQAIQLHGGVGMTEEYGVGRNLQRVMVIEQLFGETVRHMAKPGDRTHDMCLRQAPTDVA